MRDLQGRSWAPFAFTAQIICHDVPDTGCNGLLQAQLAPGKTPIGYYGSLRALQDILRYVVTCFTVTVDLQEMPAYVATLFTTESEPALDLSGTDML